METAAAASGASPMLFDPRRHLSGARSAFGFARGGRLHRGEQECNAEVGRLADLEQKLKADKK
jgi:hypothetical protein